MLKCSVELRASGSGDNSQWVHQTRAFMVHAVIWPLVNKKILINAALNVMFHFCEHQRRTPFISTGHGSRNYVIICMARDNINRDTEEFLYNKPFNCFFRSRWLLCPTGTLAATTAQPGTTLEFDTRNSFWRRQVSVHPLPFGPSSRDNEIDDFISIFENVWSQGSHTFWVTARTVTLTVQLLCYCASLLTVIALFAILRKINSTTTPNPYSA